MLRARSLVEQGADTIAFASCISKGTPIGYPCPFAKRMRELVQKEVGDGVRILDYTHDAGPEPETSQKQSFFSLRPMTSRRSAKWFRTTSPTTMDKPSSRNWNICPALKAFHMEADIEHFGRGTDNYVDAVLMIVDR